MIKVKTFSSYYSSVEKTVERFFVANPNIEIVNIQTHKDSNYHYTILFYKEYK